MWHDIVYKYLSIFYSESVLPCSVLLRDYQSLKKSHKVLERHIHIICCYGKALLKLWEQI